jgi:hypothetical protein
MELVKASAADFTRFPGTGTERGHGPVRTPKDCY